MAQRRNRATFTVLEYMYRDAGNWKTFGSVALTGTASPAQIIALREALDAGSTFIPEQVGVPPLQRQHQAQHGGGDEDLDHAFHEFVALRPANSSAIGDPAALLDVDRLVDRFVAARGRWDCTLSPFGRW